MVVEMDADMPLCGEDAAILALLGRQGSATIEQLMHLTDMSWERVFSAVDRLSRTGNVRLTRVGGDYYAEKTGGR